MHKRQQDKEVTTAAKTLTTAHGESVKELVDLEENVADAKETQQELRDLDKEKKKRVTLQSDKATQSSAYRAEESALIAAQNKFNALVTSKELQNFYSYQAFYTLAEALGPIGEYSRDLAHGETIDVNGKIGESPLGKIDYDPLNKLPPEIVYVVEHSPFENDYEKNQKNGTR